MIQVLRRSRLDPWRMSTWCSACEPSSITR